MNTKSITQIILVLLLAIFVAGCSNASPGNVTNESEIENNFDALIAEEATSSDVISFIDQNISLVSKETASTMVIKLEEIQKTDLPKLDEKYYTGNSVQETMFKIYKRNFKDFDLNNLDVIEDVELKNLLMETKALGFKVETAEGSFFPVIDYERYKEYSQFVTADIRDYIEIMAVESSNPPAKDAALIISWDEIMKRALCQEQFLIDHEGSRKSDDVKNLYKKYVGFALFGANNTPAFPYETKVLDPELKASYQSIIQTGHADSRLGKIVGEFAGILEQNDYELTNEVDAFRKEVLETLFNRDYEPFPKNIDANKGDV